MATNEPAVEIRDFKGLNNKEDRVSLTPQWFEVIDDWDIDDAGNIKLRPGISTVTSGIADGYSCDDGSNTYLIRSSDNALLELYDDGTTQVIYSDVGLGPYYWCEFGRNVYLNGRESAWEIRPDGVYTWGVAKPGAPSATIASGALPAGTYKIAVSWVRDDGVESPASEPLYVTVTADSSIQLADIPVLSGADSVVYITPPDGDRLYMYQRVVGAGITIDGDPNTWTFPLRTQYRMGVPLGVPVATFDGRTWAAVTDSIHGFTRLFYSDQMLPWYFEYDPGDPVDIPDAVVSIVGTPQGILVGGENGMYAVGVTEDGLYTVTQLTTYGAIATQHDVDESGRAYLWTKRGAVRAFPFETLTYDRLRAEHGNRACMLIRNLRGYQSLLISVQGTRGVFNPRTTPLAYTEHANGLTVPVNLGFALLLEGGDALLLESGDQLLLES